MSALQTKTHIKRLFQTHPTIHGMLKDAFDVPAARNILMGHINEMVRQLSRVGSKQEPLEFALQNQCLAMFRKIISVRSERLTNFSLLKLLWRMAREEYDVLPDSLNEGFFEEMHHFFKGMKGESGIYDQERYPEFTKLEGREASLVRSEQLDEMAERCYTTMRKYPAGLDENVKRRRAENRKRILDYFQASEEDWNYHIWQLRNVIRDSGTLSELIDLTDEEKAAIDKAKEGGLPFGITPYYVHLMDKVPHRRWDHAIRAQVIPPMDYVETMLANKSRSGHSLDFMMENKTSPIDLITRRYPSIVILKPYNTCAQTCIYCQRNWEIDDVLAPHAMASQEKINAAIEWIAGHEYITEVLVTGGDPLVMGTRRLEYILSKLAEIDHIERIRIGSRTPVVLPMRVTDPLLQVISRYVESGKRRIALVTHFEHPYEVTPEALQAVKRFKMNGISVYNQAVFTVENSRRFELSALRRVLRMIGVEPYYTFNTKGKEETKSYRVPLARLRQEIKEEARLMSGLIRTDEPVYNVPGLGKNYLRALQHHSILSILPDGRRVYEFHPWEKRLQLADTYVDTDVSIYEYLQELKRRGEDPKDYRTIWYYY